jgi:transcriptional regulator with XRE-family HTH domain
MVDQSLKKLRKTAGLKSLDVANALGITQGYYSHVELGRRKIRDTFVPILAKVLSVTEEEIESIRVSREKKGVHLKHWLSAVTINEESLLVEMVNEIKHSGKINIDDVGSFPYLMSNLVSDRIRESLLKEFKVSDKVRLFLKQKITDSTKPEEVEGVE